MMTKMIGVRSMFAAAIVAALMMAGCTGGDECGGSADDPCPAPEADTVPERGETPGATAPSLKTVAADTVEARRVEHVYTTVVLDGVREKSDTPFGSLNLESATTNLNELLGADGVSVRVAMYVFAQAPSALVGVPLSVDDDSTGAMGGMVAAMPVREGDYVAFAVPDNTGSIVVFLDYAGSDDEGAVYVFDWSESKWFETRIWSSDQGDVLAPMKSVGGARLTFSVRQNM